MVERAFTLAIGQDVTITAFGLHYPGSVVPCILTRGGTLYEVEYAHDGNIKHYEFTRDQLSSNA